MVFFVLRLNIQILTAGKGTIEQKKPTKQKMKSILNKKTSETIVFACITVSLWLTQNVLPYVSVD